MKKIISFLKKLKMMPLVVAIILSCAAFTVLIAADRSGNYDLSSLDLRSELLIGLGLTKARDGIFPWPIDVAIREVLTPKEEGTMTAEAGESSDPASPETDGEAAAGMTEDQETTASSEETEEAGLSEEDGTLQEETAADDAEEEASLESTEEELSEEELEALKEQQEKELNPTYIHADEMPEEVNDPVVQAKDYGNAEKAYLSPDDETYNEDTEGIFAGNGDYYKFQDVEDSYLSDALIIGNSRTEGLHGYSTIQNYAYFACKEGVSVYNILKQNINFYTPDGKTSSAMLTDILAANTYRKIYISLGINEVGIGTSKQFYENYRSILETIREYQPDAIIFIEGMLHVSKERSQTSSVFSNKIVVQRNLSVSTLANGHDIFYIDVNSALCDEDGDLPNDITADGIHLYAAEYEKWHAFLLTRGIIRTDADKGAEAAAEPDDNPS